MIRIFEEGPDLSKWPSMTTIRFVVGKKKDELPMGARRITAEQAERMIAEGTLLGGTTKPGCLMCDNEAKYGKETKGS